MKSLDQIGIEHESDKSSRVHGYLFEYEQLFHHLRFSAFDLVEIGPTVSHSAKMWSEFFPNASIKVIGTHLSPELDGIPRVEPIHVQNYEAETLAIALKEYAPLIVIDDGTHKWSHQKNAFAAVFPLMKSGGYFILEDAQTNVGKLAENFADSDSSFADFAVSRALQLASGDTSTPSSQTTDSLDFAALMVSSVQFSRKFIVLQKENSSVETFRESSVTHSNAQEQFSISSQSYARIDGQLLNAGQYIANKFNALKGEGTVGLGTVHSAVLAHPTVYSGGLTCSKDGDILDETLNCIRNLRESHDFKKMAPSGVWQSKNHRESTFVPAIEGRQMVLLKSAWDKNYGHWLYDSFSRLSLLESIDLHGKKPLFVINNHSGAIEKVMRRSLELAGYGDEDILALDGSPHTFESLIVLGNLSYHPTLKAPEATSFLESIAAKRSPSRVKRVYLSRNAYSRRRLVNEDALWTKFEQRGFEMVYPETLSFDEQLELFSGAHVVAGNMGAAFSNLAFSPKGVKVLTLATPAMAHDFFYDITCHKQGKYVAVQGTTTDENSDLSSDFTIEPELLDRAFELLDL